MQYLSRNKRIIQAALVHLFLIALLWQSDLNRDLFLFFNNGVQWPALWANITILGDGYLGALMLLTLALADRRRINEILYLMFFTAVLTFLFKAGFDIKRPAAVLNTNQLHIFGPVLTRYSFPSGHSATFFMYLFVLWPLCARWPEKVLLILAAYTGAFSRIMVGAHWPADIAGGFLTAGTGWLLANFIRGKYNPSWNKKARQFLLIIFGIAAIGAFFYDTHYPRTKAFQYTLLLTSLGYTFIKARDSFLKE